MTRIIADSGSTKTTWAFLQGGRKIITKTQGISPYFLSGKEIETVLLEELMSSIRAHVNETEVEEIFFYGTGVSAVENAKIMKNALRAVFMNSIVEVNQDLTGAARALCQHKKGIACILGTGSGACYFDGEKMAKMSPGLGFILGDEGSGAYLGKMLVRKFLYKKLDIHLLKAFDAEYNLSKSKILQKVYQEDCPNRFLASFTKFLGKHRTHPEVEELLKEGLSVFFKLHITDFKNVVDLPIHFVGGVAFAFSDILIDLCEQYNLNCGRILKEPIDGLISYHKKA